MNTQPEQLKHLGFFAIFKESYKIIVSNWRYIFSKIFLALIFPFCLLMLADMLISSHLQGRIIDNAINLYDMDSTNRYYDSMKRELSLHSTLLGVFTLLYFLVGLLVLNLFAISAISYAVVCIYASKDTNFKQVIRVVPKAWKKLVLTYLWNLFLQLVFIAVFIALAVLCLVIGIRAQQIAAIVVGVIVVILFIMGIIYFNVMWGMASVVSALEECRGPRAFRRGGDLMKGKKKLNIGVYMVFLVLLVVIQGGYWVLAGLFNSSLPIVVYVIVAIVFFLLLLGLVMLGLVVQTVLYLVCKSYHNESIDKASLGDQLDGNMGGSYGRLGGAKDVQLGEV
ncbi:hypothetical protein Sjap_018427 [Stephania japonica]|uniref:Uncharacterized protein n=1 Tax=Stephania japonica TaxID=461633 RepID=A0AAP0I826_9MAGN